MIPARTASSLRRRTHRRRRRAVSLVEVLATLVLVGIVLPAAMHGSALSLRAAQHARHQQEAGLLAEARLNELLAMRDPADAADVTAAIAGKWPEYELTTQTTAADFGLSQVAVTVGWLERGRRRSLTLTTLICPATATDTSTLDGTPTP